MVRDYHRRKKILSFVPLYGRHGSTLSTRETDQAEAKDIVERVMARLPRDAVQCLILYEIEGFTTAEVATILGVKADAVRQRIVRARKRFRKAYQCVMGSDTE